MTGDTTSMASVYATRPTKVEAYQVDPEGHARDYPEWLRQAVCLPQGYAGRITVYPDTVGVITTVGWQFAHPGDWIVYHGIADIRVIKSGDFDKLYEEAV